MNERQEPNNPAEQELRLTADRRMRDLQIAWCLFDVGPIRSLDDFGKRLWPFMTQTSRSNLESVPVGVLHSHQMWKPAEVAAFEYSDGIRFIAIDYRFINFLYLVDAFVLSQLSAEEEGDTGPNTAEINARGIISQFARFDTSLANIEIQELTIESLPEGYPQVHHAWLDVQQLFLVGYEYAHFILGHIGSSRLTPVKVGGQEYVLPGGITLGLVTRTQEEELHADQQGAAMTINAILADKNLTEFGREVCIAGIDVFFLILHIIDHILFKDIPTSTHPSGNARHLSWRQHFSGRLLGKGGETGRWAESFVKQVIGMYDSGKFSTMSDAG